MTRRTARNRNAAPTSEQSPLGEQRWVTERAIRILRLPQAMDAVGLRRAAIYNLQAQDRFPRRIKITGGRAVGWIEAEVQEWLRQRIRNEPVSHRSTEANAVATDSPTNKRIGCRRMRSA